MPQCYTQPSNRNEPWRSNERHYCKVCNSWMGSDRQSILIHENGKKHRENVEANLVSRRKEKLRKENEKSKLESSLQQMEKIAAEAMSRDTVNFGKIKNHQNSQFANGGVAPSNPSNSNTSYVTKKSVRDDKEKTTLVVQGDEKKTMENKKQLGPDEGYYTIGETTYLEGSTFAPLFEEDMTVEIWTGSSSMTTDYMKDASSQELWKNGIILKVHKDRNVSSGKETEESAMIKCNVSYLNNINDEDETIEKRVDSSRIRLIVGSDAFIPSTIEEARLALLGGEEVTVLNNPTTAEIDENTGLSSWTVSSVRKTTVNCELQKERLRLRAKKREEERKEAGKLKEAEGRRMEEAKHENADDSALGAYDIWSTAGKVGYKGVRINANAKLTVNETAKSLSGGRTDVKFKKRGNNNKKTSIQKRARRRNPRTTFSDED